MTTAVYFIVDLAITDGKIDEFEAIAQKMTEGTRQESGAIAYEFYPDADRKRCRLIEIYADSDAALAHVNGEVVQRLVPQILEVSSISRFGVYGDLKPETATVLKGVGADIFGSWHGFNRF